MEPAIFLFAVLFTALPIILLIVFISRVNSLTTRVRWLEQELLRFKSVAPPAALQEPVVTVQPSAIVEAKPAPPPSPAPAAQPPPPGKILQQTVEKQKTSKAREEWEAFVGGKLLNRIGAFALIIGVGFFLKYAFDNNWITETMRVVLGGVAGIALLVLGARFHRNAYQVFAQGLIGAGIAILYLSVFASFNFYHLVSQLTAFALMSAVTVIAFSQAFRYDSLAISLLAWAGGYLTPFMLSTGVSNEAGLFSYIDVLEAGLLAVVLIRQQWTILELLTLIGTYTTFSLWYANYYSENAFLLSISFLTLFWMLFTIADIYRIVTNAQPRPLRQVVNILNAGVYYSYLYALVNGQHHELMGLLTIILACLYALPALLAFRKNPKSPMVRDYIMTTAILLIIATSIQFSGFTTITIWACEAFVLMWCARRWSYRYLEGATLIFFVVITGKLLFTDGVLHYVPVTEFIVVFNKRFLAFCTLSVSMLISAHLLANFETREREILRRVLHIGWCILMVVLLTGETVDFFSRQLIGASVGESVGLEFTRNMTLLCIWMLYSLPLVYFGLKKSLSPVLISGLTLTGAIFTMAVIWGISIRPIEDFRLFLNVRMLAVVLVLGGSVMIARWLKDSHGTVDVASSVYPALLIGQVMLLLLLFSGETRDMFEQKMFFLQNTGGVSSNREEMRSLENMKQLSLSMLWLLYGIALTIAGIWQRIRAMRLLAILILGTAVLKIFIYDLSFLQTLYRIFAFIGLGLILLAASYLYQRYKSLIIGNDMAGENGTRNKQ